MCGPSRRCYAPYLLPLGCRFIPEDHELINEFLKKKINNQRVPPYAPIRSVNVYNLSPRELIEAYHNRQAGVWYFFTPRDRKRLHRAAGNGYWKCHGTKKQIYHNNIRIGYKNSLIFYQGEPPSGKETVWIMKEYIVDQPPRQKNDMRLENCVACRIHMRSRRQSSRNKNKLLLSSFAKLRIGKATSFLNMRSKKLATKRIKIEHREGTSHQDNLPG